MDKENKENKEAVNANMTRLLTDKSLDELYVAESAYMLHAISKLMALQWCVKHKKSGLKYSVKDIYAEEPYENPPMLTLECCEFQSGVSEVGEYYWSCSSVDSCKEYAANENTHDYGGADGACNIGIELRDIFDFFEEV